MAKVPMLFLLVAAMLPTSLAMRKQMTNMFTAQLNQRSDADAMGNATASLFTFTQATSLIAGNLFHDRFTLIKKLSDFGRESSSLGLAGDPDPRGIPGWSNFKRLGKGSFGEAWEATGMVPGERREKTVVLKIFYRNIDGQMTYITQNLLEGPLSGDEEAKEEIKSVQDECVVVQEIQRQAKRAGDLGGDRFIGCYQVVSGSGDDPMYVILEPGGDSLSKWIKDHRGRPDVKTGRIIMGNLLQAIRSMSELYPVQLIHHDMKPDNSVFDGSVARLIDFGGVMAVGAEDQSAVCTVPYAPPEYLGENENLRGIAFWADEPWSYDVFGLGVMYMEIMCPATMILQVGFDLLQAFARARGSRAKADTKRALQAYCAEEGSPIARDDLESAERMTAFEPSYRPSPSNILRERQFIALYGEMGEPEGGVAPVVPRDEEPDEGLSQSIMVLKGDRGNNFKFNFQARLAKVEKENKWVDGFRCKIVKGSELITTIEESRKQCLRVCAAYFTEKFDYLMKKPASLNAQTACCQLGYNQGSYGERKCSWGFGGVQPMASQSKASGNYAILVNLRHFKPK